jgi:HlyD family secretion protein
MAAAVAVGFRKQPVPVEMVPLAEGPLRITIEEEGRTRVADRYIVSTPVAGYAERIVLKVGDRVTAGQIVSWLQPPLSPVLDTRAVAQQQARVHAAEAALRAAEESARAATADEAYWTGQRDRMEKLHKSGDMSKEAWDRAASEALRFAALRKSSQHAVDQARAELEAARAALRYSAASPPPESGREKIAVRAPVGGRVLKVIRESEGTVTPGEPLFELANTRALEAEVELLSADAVRVQPGMKVLFERWGGDAALEGRVRLIEPVAFTKISALGVEEQRVKVLVTITSPTEQWNRLGDQYRVEASFVLWEAEAVPLIPSSALFRLGDGWAVFVVEEGIARRRVVEAGQRNARHTQILSGIEPGELVIVHPDDSIEDGVKVVAR